MAPVLHQKHTSYDIDNKFRRHAPTDGETAKKTLLTRCGKFVNRLPDMQQ
jgi:hypothetical protein